MKKIDRKILKKNAHINLKRNFFMSILIVFVLSFLINEHYNFSTELIINNPDIKEINETINIKDDDFETKIEQNEKLKGVLAPIVSRLGISKSPITNFSYSIKLFYKDKNINKGFYSLFIALISLLIFIFIKLVLDIGKIRFFLESRIYHKTSAIKILFPYKVKGTLHLSLILFLKRLYQFLWSLTIIGGFIKMYEYQMIPYILAENPTISRKDAFKLSKQMMYGYKWEAFKLDLSFINWILLGLITLGISNLVYFNAYREFVFAELYYNLRNKTKNKLLNDTYLFDNKDNLEIYPDDKLKVKVKKLSINRDYNQKYSITNYILIFFTATFIGYSWEVFLHIIEDGTFVNRGVMLGPWLPIYGFGCLLILILLKPFRDKPFIFFIACMILAGILEYSTSWALETFKHMKWWDYSGYFLNINGRICLEGLIVFGLGGAVITYILGPILNTLYNKLSHKVAITICVILLSVFSIDMVYSHFHPNSGQGITDYQENISN